MKNTKDNMNNRPVPIILDHRIDLYIPSQCICGDPLPEELRGTVIEHVKSTFHRYFGASTQETVLGGWTLPNGVIAKEEIAKIYSYCTYEQLEEYREDVNLLAVDIANRLTQDRVLLVVDDAGALWPNTLGDNLRPTQTCACCGCKIHGATTISQPITDIDKFDIRSKMLVLQGILQSFNSTEHARKMFCEILKYCYASDDLPYSDWPDGTKSLLVCAPKVLGNHNGFKIIYLHLSSDNLRYGAQRQVIQRIYNDPTFRGVFVVSNKLEDNWELVNVKMSEIDSKQLILRRIHVGIEAIRTATERLSTLEVAEDENAAHIQEMHDKAFDVEAVTKEFFAEIANWYFWALKNVKFPKDAPKENDGHDHISVIRMITRLIFCWFIKEKNLIPSDLFDERILADLLVGFEPNNLKKKESAFYKAVLQNLFFATLNMEMDNRGWRREGQNLMAHSLYRYKSYFTKPEKALERFKDIPFLNGGLFECLDKDLGEGEKHRYIRVDGFSDRVDSQAIVPDFLFFSQDRVIDLSQEYDDKKFNKVKVRGLIHTLNHYRFTIEESTPLEEEVALDPELAGKIFENLLAAYNPETGATARKQTGSFYTPREIVSYMVDESLIAYLKGKLKVFAPTANNVEPRLRQLLSYENMEAIFTPAEEDCLIAAIDDLKVIDPAVGSGAFPMGVLHKLVYILGRLDVRNKKWKDRQKKRLQETIEAAEKIEDVTSRENTLRELEQQVLGIEEAFEKNTLNYGRKLYLIENCIYGIDIQSIAVQIAKMRFFISLVADQKVDTKAPNRGIRPLPNLETKLIAANTLIGIDKSEQMMLRNPSIDMLSAELKRVRERHFLARTPTSKAKCREQDKILRDKIASLLKYDGWDDRTAKQLASWDPYNQNSSSTYFDAEWMFGLADGFDIVIGNPPWGASLTSDEKLLLKNEYPEIDSSTPNSFAYFIGWSFRQYKSAISYVLPDSLLIKDYAKTRQLIMNNISEIVWYENSGVPDGHRPFIYVDHDVSIVNILKEKQSNLHYSLHKYNSASGKIVVHSNDHAKSKIILEEFDFAYNLIASEIDLKILDSIKSFDKLDGFLQCHEGIHTGNSRDILFHNTKRNKFCKPLFYGGGAGDLIENYSSKASGWYVDYRKEIIDKENGYYASLRDENIFQLPKIYITRTGNPFKAFYDDKTYASNNFFSLQHKNYKENTPDFLKFVMPFIVSKPAQYFIRRFAAPRIGNTFIETKIFHLLKFRIPLSTPHKSLIVNIVNYTLTLKNNSMPSDYFEQLIAAIVYELYFPLKMQEYNCEVVRRLVDLPIIKDDWDEVKKIKIIESVYKKLTTHEHQVSIAMDRLKTIPEIKIIEGYDK